MQYGYEANSLRTDLLTYPLTEWFIELHFAAKNTAQLQGCTIL